MFMEKYDKYLYLKPKSKVAYVDMTMQRTALLLHFIRITSLLQWKASAQFWNNNIKKTIVK